MHNRRLSTTHQSWITRACCLALFAALAWPVPLRRVFPIDDIHAYHVPMRQLYQRILADGDWPLWTPALFAGFDLHGEGQLGAFHPLHQFLYRVLPLDLALNFEILLAYAAGVAGMYWVLRRLAIVPDAALVGAMAYGFGGFMLTHYPHVSMIGAVSHLPWLLGCFDVLVLDDARSHRTAAYAAAALLVASQVLLGFPQAVWWTVVAGSAFVLWRAGASRRWNAAFAPAAAVVTGCLIGAVQLLPMLSAATRSTRAQESQAFLVGYSLHPWNIVQLWSPYTLQHRAYAQVDKFEFHEFALYPTAFLVLAPLWLWVRRAALAHRRSLIAATSVFAAVMFVLALGRYGKLANLLLYLPGVGSLRAPARYIVLLQLALAILAAIAYEDLAAVCAAGGVSLSRRAVAALSSLAVLNILTILLLNGGIIHVPADLSLSSVRHALGGTVFVVGATVLLLLAARGRRLALLALVVLTTIDQSAWSLVYLHRTPPLPLDRLARPIPSNTTGQPMRLASAPPWQNVPLLNGYQLVGGYVGLYPQTTLSWESDAFRRLAGAQRRLDKKLQVAELSDGVARARLLSDVHLATDVLGEIDRIDLQRTALVTSAIPPLAGPPGSAQLSVDRPGHLKIAVDAPGRQLLCLSERDDPGWTATVDGLNVPIVRADGDFLGVLVDAGVHDVELRFMPKSFIAGALVSAAALATLLLVTVTFMRR